MIASAPVRRSAPPVRQRTGCGCVRECASAPYKRRTAPAHTPRAQQTNQVRKCAEPFDPQRRCTDEGAADRPRLPGRQRRHHPRLPPVWRPCWYLLLETVRQVGAHSVSGEVQTRTRLGNEHKHSRCAQWPRLFGAAIRRGGIVTAADVAAALAVRCGLCKAPAGAPCRNTIRPGQPLPGRAVHWMRLPVATGDQGAA
ncbi:zinc finger domain-containing protein [Mycobacterium avium]|uniref:zinc finger domain-containing protein n=1 Tax=Mycobacterium avium TaxID=1764 RepID=UPI003F54144B